MTARHFGIPTVRAGLGGNEHRPARSRADTPRDINSSDRELGALVFVAACVASPFLIAGICLFVIHQFS